MMSRKNNVKMRELNDHIDHKKFGNYLNQLVFADDLKHFSLKHE